ncbi:MAG: hypothetical protein L0Z50_07605, partial [Verrucomicrobiales bacterium]|nr:hypothetical protein [Verrucomicrobiales bacterium]
GYFVLPSGTGALTNAAFASPAVNDAVAAELNHQRAMTRAVTQQSEMLSGSLREFSSALARNRTLMEQNKALREQLAKTERRLDALEAEFKKQVRQTPSVENDTK